LSTRLIVDIPTLRIGNMIIVRYADDLIRLAASARPAVSLGRHQPCEVFDARGDQSAPRTDQASMTS
jgi:hypothetical protein